jgi:aldehyde:ferredoxin oxidoreductase
MNRGSSTGWAWATSSPPLGPTTHELLKAGERAYTMAQAFNAREGFTAAEDRLPARFFEPFDEGPSAGNALPPDEFDRARVAFYQMMGWDGHTAICCRP